MAKKTDMAKEQAEMEKRARIQQANNERDLRIAANYFYEAAVELGKDHGSCEVAFKKIVDAAASEYGSMLDSMFHDNKKEKRLRLYRQAGVTDPGKLAAVEFAPMSFRQACLRSSTGTTGR